ncbi:dnaJ homolog subfamily C member 7-like isoform X2 [Cotesia typhae]|uniref:dnaJ homolog subfamily C member 7-like isoform X2 n=1 Tax=Cotesia typhae TaxID=2053667 RepID=UPI003D68595B
MFGVGSFFGGIGHRCYDQEEFEEYIISQYGKFQYSPRRKLKKTRNRASNNGGGASGTNSPADCEEKVFSATDKHQQKKEMMVCFNCGLRWHKMHQCPAEGKVCLKCGEKNHFARICRTSGEKTPLASEAMKKDTAANNHQGLKPKKMKENIKGTDSSTKVEKNKKDQANFNVLKETNVKFPKKNDNSDTDNDNSSDKSNNVRTAPKVSKSDPVTKTKLTTENVPLNVKSNVQSPSAAIKIEEEKKERMMKEKKDEANILYKQKKYKLALSQYTRLIELCPTSELNYGNRAACYIMMERYEDGLADAKRSVELNSTFVRGHERAIRCLIELGNITEAGTWVKKLESVDPKNERLSVEKEKINNTTRYLNKIDKLSSEKKYAEAVKYLDKLIAVSSQYVSYKMRKAEFWVLLEKYKEAEPLINDILKRNQSNLDVVYLLGRCLYYLDTERAIPQLKEVFRLVPDHSDGLKLYKNAKALIDKKNEGNNAFIHRKYSKAHKIYSEALQIDPSNQRMMMKLYYNLAQASYKLDEISKSIEECTKALAIDPNFYKALLRRGQNYVETCDYEEAVADFTKAVNIESSSEARKLLDEAKKLLAKAKNDYHGILGVKKNASMDDIKKAYHEKAKLHHPDRHSSGSLEEKVNNEKKFKEITRAYRSLTNGFFS